MLQRTIAKPVTCAGIGLHSGRKVGLALRPAAPDTGILFSIKDGEGHHFITPSPEAVRSTQLATTLVQGSRSVATVEHLLAALRGMSIDNIHVEIDGAEVPIMDGSAAPFVYLLRLAGVREQNRPSAAWRVKRPVEFSRDGKSISAKPHDGFALDYTIDFAHPRIGRQRLALELNPELFSDELARARTFGFLSEVEMLRANGLALGGSLENAVVLDDFGIVNADGLRFDDEFVRHKALDFIGDMALLDAPLQGAFTVYASGHGLNNAFLRHLVAEDLLERVESAPQAPAPERGRDRLAEGAPALA